jgi:4a-hydroxytetrahydrobiopterin dehydratase
MARQRFGKRLAVCLCMAKLSTDQVKSRLGSTPGWALEGEAIRRQFTFSGFAEAIAFVVRLAFDAEAADHHPDILVNYKRVSLTYSTHSAGGLTEKDFAGAAKATELARAMGTSDEANR